MARTPRAVGWTADDLLALGEQARFEVDEGELVPLSPTSRDHAVVAANVLYVIKRHVLRRGLGEVYAAEAGFVLRRDPVTVRAPDVAFVAANRLASAGDPDGFVRVAPDVAVEVLSPHDRAIDVQRKVRQFLDAGTRAVWVVDPRSRSVAVHRPGGAAPRLTETDTLEEPVLDDFRCPVAELLDGPRE